MKIVVEKNKTDSQLQMSVGPSYPGEEAPTAIEVALMLNTAATNILSSAFAEIKQEVDKIAKPNIIILPKPGEVDV